MNSLAVTFLASAISRVSYYKSLGDKSMAQLQEADFYVKPNETANSISVIIQHMAGNMISRWTNFLTEDGEKDWRNRDTEFDESKIPLPELLALWEKGWACFLSALNQLSAEDLLKTIYIRTESLTVVDAINRQLSHYPYHVGQIVYVARLIKNKEWESLSIPPGRSIQYNKEMKISNQ